MSHRLSSDLLEKQFGPTHIEILYQDDRERIIRTVANETGQTLEISYVLFAEGASEQVKKIRQAIAAGESMGKAFRSAGIAFERQQYDGYKYRLPPSFTAQYDSGLPATVLAVRILAGEHKELFADILETYHPSVKWNIGGLSTYPPKETQLKRIERLNGFLATL